MVGQRDAGFATEFIADLKKRLYKMYLTAVADTFDWNEVDYAQLVKIYRNDPEGQKRDSPAVCTGCEKHEITKPDPKHISTSYVERQNLTTRMSMRRFTRLTNAFSKKVRNHMSALAVYFMYYNYVRPHQTLKTTPAVKAGIAERPWSIEEIVELLEKTEQLAVAAGSDSN